MLLKRDSCPIFLDGRCTNTFNFGQLLNRNKLPNFVSIFDNRLGFGRADVGQGLKLLDARRVDIDRSESKGDGGNAKQH